jgi:hypothetical protein
MRVATPVLYESCANAEGGSIYVVRLAGIVIG